MANKDYTAAEAVKLFIGDFEFDAIRVIETGEYRMSRTQVLQSAGESRNWLVMLASHAPEVNRKLTSKGFSHVSVSVKYTVVSKSGKKIGTRADSMSLSDVRILWRFLDKHYDKPEADALVSALTEDSLCDRFDQVYGKERISQDERRRRDNRVMKKPCPWDLMYQLHLCRKIQKWYGFDSSKFYWWYCYDFLSTQERADIDEYNPLIPHVSKSGATRTIRKARIHQHLSKETRERLHDFADYLWRLVELCDSRVEFEKKWNAKYGQPTQLEIFDLWEFAS